MSPLRRFAASPRSCGRGEAPCGPAKPDPRVPLKLPPRAATFSLT